jgi:hypothetical protein
VLATGVASCGFQLAIAQAALKEPRNVTSTTTHLKTTHYSKKDMTTTMK